MGQKVSQNQPFEDLIGNTLFGKEVGSDSKVGFLFPTYTY